MKNRIIKKWISTENPVDCRVRIEYSNIVNNYPTQVNYEILDYVGDITKLNEVIDSKVKAEILADMKNLKYLATKPDFFTGSDEHVIFVADKIAKNVENEFINQLMFETGINIIDSDCFDNIKNSISLLAVQLIADGIKYQKFLNNESE